MLNRSDPIFTDEDAARRWLEARRWPDGATCPFCDGRERVRLLAGKSMGAGWYHCGRCRRKFTVRAGTLYERSHVPLHKWLLATYVICVEHEKAVTVELLRSTLDVSYRTAWRMTRQLRDAMKQIGSPVPDKT